MDLFLLDRKLNELSAHVSDIDIIKKKCNISVKCKLKNEEEMRRKVMVEVSDAISH